jgi:hypothetical protein
LPLRREAYDYHAQSLLASPYPTLNARSTRCPGSTCVSFHLLTRCAMRVCSDDGNDCVAQYVPLAYRRQPELPARRARFPGHCAKRRIQLRFSVHPAGRRTYRVLRRRGEFPLFGTTTSNLYLITLQRGIDVLVVCVFFGKKEFSLFFAKKRTFWYRKLTHRGTPRLSPSHTRSTSRAPKRRLGLPTRTSRPQDSCALPRPTRSILPWTC